MKRISQQQAMCEGLPKWQQMLVKGDTISEELAKEIIFATDRSLLPHEHYTNDKSAYSRFRKACGYDLIDSKFDEGRYVARYDMYQRVEDKLNILRYDYNHDIYVHNTWGFSSYIFGPNGWCHPDGTISFKYNVGKWPNVEDVLRDWKTIAKRWPTLNVLVTLMSGESGEDFVRPVVTFKTSKGKVTCYEGTIESFTDIGTKEEFNRSLRSIITTNMLCKETGLPSSWYDEFAAKVRPIVLEELAAYNLVS